MKEINMNNLILKSITFNKLFGSNEIIDFPLNSLNVFIGDNFCGKDAIFDLSEFCYDDVDPSNKNISFNKTISSDEISYFALKITSKLNFRLINVKNLLTLGDKVKPIRKLLEHLCDNKRYKNDSDNIVGDEGGIFLLNIVHALLVDKPKVLVIYYPETMIHPSYHSWIGDLIQEASSTTIQILMTTNSKDILNSFENIDDIIFVGGFKSYVRRLSNKKFEAPYKGKIGNYWSNGYFGGNSF